MSPRLSKFARLLVIVVLLSSVACSELPELASLSDNASNDFTIQSCIAAEVAIAAPLQAAKVLASCIPPRAEFLDVQPRKNVFGISRDLLLLYSILRT